MLATSTWPGWRLLPAHPHSALIGLGYSAVLTQANGRQPRDPVIATQVMIQAPQALVSWAWIQRMLWRSDAPPAQRA